MIGRCMRPLIGESLSDARVVMVVGARQVGKSAGVFDRSQREAVERTIYSRCELATATPSLTGRCGQCNEGCKELTGRRLGWIGLASSRR
jgi:bacterioferritin-associated ferredoxin